MRTPHSILILFAFTATIHAFAIPARLQSIAETSVQLFRRKGGGGGGGHTSSSHSSSSHSSSSSATSSHSNIGGTYGKGSGPSPTTYSNGHSYYGGGSYVPYRSGSASPGGLTGTYYPYTYPAMVAFGGSWPNGAFLYMYNHDYTFVNETTKQNETLPVECLCAKYAECGCDANNETDYVNNVANDQTLAHVGVLHGEQTLIINGTLPNGTTAASAAGSYRQSLAQVGGWWAIAAGIAYGVLLL